MDEDVEIEGWFSGRLPKDWFKALPSVQTDREEILVIGEIDEPQAEHKDQDAARAAAVAAAQQYAPGLLRAAGTGANPRAMGGRRSGRWIRRGRNIIIVNC